MENTNPRSRAFGSVRIGTSQLTTRSGVFPLANISSAQVEDAPHADAAKAGVGGAIGLIMLVVGLVTWGMADKNQSIGGSIVMVFVGAVFLFCGVVLSLKRVATVVVTMTGGERIAIAFPSSPDRSDFLSSLSAAVEAVRQPTHVDARQVHIHRDRDLTG